MRALVCESWREFDDLELKEIPPPPLRPGGVRIAVEGAGVSFATQLVVAGKYQRKPPLPFVPGTEIVGRVIESAPDVPARCSGGHGWHPAIGYWCMALPPVLAWPVWRSPPRLAPR